LDPRSGFQDPGWKQIIENQIRDKHPGSATLIILIVRLRRAVASNLESQNKLFFYIKHSYEALFSKLGLGNNQASFNQVEGPIRSAAFFNLFKNNKLITYAVQ
jgi:hypothetical protein